MHASILLTTLTLLPAVLGAPRRPHYYSRQNDSAPSAPSCDVANTPQPPSTLTPPTGLTLVLIALGQGTQNYTCGSDPSLAPTSIGALANLYNASCPSPPTGAADAASAAAIGSHFFVDNTTPDFLITGLGNTQAKKVEDAPAPDPSKDVKWLRLAAQAGSSSSVKMIYRLHTKGGVAPANCEGRAAGEVVTVGYQAEYWVYS